MNGSRRRFLRGASAVAAGAGLLAARGREGLSLLWPDVEAGELPGGGALILSSNENPVGPGAKVVAAVNQVVDARGPGRYPRAALGDLHDALAALHGVRPENVAVGCGSGQILRTATQVFTSPGRPLATAETTYEACARYAALIGSPVRALPLDARFRLDLEAMGEGARGAGLVFFCNPNNPTATLHPAAAVDVFVDEVRRDSPGTTLLIDEAYHDYVTDPAHRSQAARAAADPRVLVSRTFSKAHGMAGLRLGYAIGHPDTIKAMADWEGPGAVNCLALAAGCASVAGPDRLRAECARNEEARSFTLAGLARLGCLATESQANFVFVDVGRPARVFREACQARGILVGRDFPPFEKAHCRISIGTLAEMKRALPVFEAALRATAEAT